VVALSVPCCEVHVVPPEFVFGWVFAVKNFTGIPAIDVDLMTVLAYINNHYNIMLTTQRNALCESGSQDALLQRLILSGGSFLLVIYFRMAIRGFYRGEIEFRSDNRSTK
jgi:hypothetical protein